MAEAARTMSEGRAAAQAPLMRRGDDRRTRALTRTSGIHSGERGFTIIEVMVAVFILVLGVLGVATMANTANIQSSTSKARVGGTNLAREVLEDARSFPYADLSGNVPAGSGSTTLQSDLSGVGLTDASVANGW